jgi:uncharacterized delta-60 repeat protein
MWFRLSHKPRPASPARPRLEALEDRCLLSAGALDPTFGSGAGYVTTSLSSTGGKGQQVLLQPSGDIVVAGQTSVPVTTTTKHGTTTINVNAFGVVEYNPDGSVNTSFGSGGVVRQLFSGSSNSFLSSAALEPMGPTGDSKILLVGTVYSQGGMALMRLNANGTLDTTFGNNGQVLTTIQTSSANFSGEGAKAVAVTSGGQILVVGQDTPINTVLLARYNPDGGLDTTFGSGGTATTVFSTRTGVLAMAQQPDGKFVVACSNQTPPSGAAYQGMVLRYNANGSLDSTFGNGGIVTTAIPFGTSPSTYYRGVAVYPNAGTANDGKILVAGHVQGFTSGGPNEALWVAVRYNPNGSLDSAFGGGAGYEIIPDPKFTYPTEVASAVAIEPDGKPILVGEAQAASGPTYSQVARLNVDGSLDTTFGTGGLVTTAIGTINTTGGTNSQFYAVAVQADGNLVAAGIAQLGNQGEFSLARYLPSEPEVGSFTANPNPVTAGSSATLTASGITDANPGATITQVAFYYYDSTGTKQVLGYGAQTSPGVWTLNYAVSLASGTYTHYAQAEDSYGVFGDPFALTLTVQ